LPTEPRPCSLCGVVRWQPWRLQSRTSGKVPKTSAIPVNSASAPTRSHRIVAGFLALSYGLGAPFIAALEWRGHFLSHRFAYPPELIYGTCALQLLCVGGVLHRRFAPWAAAGLTLTTLGAVASHLRIGSPLTALPAILYTAVQIWFGLQSRPVK
jgi:DoxX-like family